MNIKFCPTCGGSVVIKNHAGRKRKQCKECGLIIYENPRPVAAVAVLKQGKILLVKRGIEPAKGKWCLPCGYMEIGESPIKAAERELIEETGLTAMDIKIYNALAEKSKDYGSVAIFFYLSENPIGKLKAGDDAVAVDFFEYNNLPEIAFSSHFEIIESLIGNAKLYRVIDAAFNRTIEGLRTVEDFMRFILDNKDLYLGFKQLRHEVLRNIRKIGQKQIISQRDTEHDSGRKITLNSEKKRNNNEVLLASLSRVKEGLRALEEFIKVIDSNIAMEFKNLRYEFYIYEKKVVKIL